MILSKYEDVATPDTWWIDIEFKNLLKKLSCAILGSINDPKGMQRDLDKFSFTDGIKISNALSSAYDKACEVVSFEVNDKDQKKSINKWREVLGTDFPNYTGNRGVAYE